jgi:hypothetical protein
LTILPDALWEELRAVAPPEAEPKNQSAAPESSGTEEAAMAKRRAIAEPLWAALAVGDVVLARDYDREGESVGWEAVVLAPADGDAFTLGWPDYPEQGLVRRKRAELALLHPGSAAPAVTGAPSPAK